jgi:phosphomannomutase
MRAAEVLAGSAARFGTSGLRGKVEVLNAETVTAAVAAFVDLCGEGPVWLGHDLRPSSPAIAANVIAALEATGCSTRFCGEIATPALAHAAFVRREAAIMVTGSHIPFDRNGLKFFPPERELSKADEAVMLVSKAEVPLNLSPAPLPSPDRTASRQYRQRYEAAFPDLLNGWTVAHLQHSAAGRDELSALLEALGATVLRTDRSEDFVAVDTENISPQMTKRAVEIVRKGGTDAAIATDGDGDRPLLADETGQWFRGDALGLLAAHALGATRVVTPVTTTSAAELSGFFDTLTRTRVGSPYVIEKLGNGVGFEANGGLLTGGTFSGLTPLPTRDSVLPILAVIRLARERDVPLSALRDLLPSRHTQSGLLRPVEAIQAAEMLEKLEARSSHASALHPADIALTDIDTTDGLRFMFSDRSIIHLRPSGNAPELRLYTEDNTADTAQALLSHAMNTTRAWLEGRW